jgi:hypothetical protein
MMNELLLEIIVLAVAVIAVTALSVAAMTAARQRHLVREMEERLKIMRLDISSMNSGSVGVGKRLQEVEKKILQKKEAAVAVAEQGYEPYSQATRLFDSGANIEDVVRNCGITRAEAELMGLMHKQMKRRGSHPW